MKTSRLIALVSPLVVWIAAAGAAVAAPKADTDGNVTAYDYEGKKVLLVVACERGALGPEYPSCVAKVKREVKDKACAPGVGKVIAGKTYFKYRMGAIKTLIADNVGTCSGSSGSSGSSDEPAGDEPTIKGDKGSCGAYELSGKVIVEKSCERRNGSYDYVAFGKRVRDEAKAQICRKKGKGSHDYLYRSGDSKARKSSVFCGG
jgi:hypothetical protein